MKLWRVLWAKDGGVGRKDLRGMESRCQALGGQRVGVSVLIFSESQQLKKIKDKHKVRKKHIDPGI